MMRRFPSIAGAVLALAPFLLQGQEDGGHFAEVERLYQRVSLVSRHHIQAPATQQMILTLARAIYEVREEIPPAELASQVGLLTRSEQFRDFLHSCLAGTENRERAANFAIHALLRSLPGDCSEAPAKEYLVRQQLAANRYVGIGIVLGKSDGIPTAMKVFPGGPLDLAGGKDGVQIWQIDGEDVRKAELNVVVDKLRGERGTQVRLGLTPKGGAQLIEKTVTRGVVPMRALKEPEMVDPTVAYLAVSQFQASVAHEIRGLEPQLRQRGAKAVILDLRNLRPGRVHDVVLLADALLPGGTIGAIGGRALEAGEDALLTGMPLAILVDRTTNGSLEWLAASLQRNGRALLVGGLTTGRPWGYDGFEIPGEERYLLVPSQILSLEPGKPLVRLGAVDDLPPNARRATQNWGVAPDIWVGGEMLNQSMRAGFKAERVAVEQAKAALLEKLATAG